MISIRNRNLAVTGSSVHPFHWIPLLGGCDFIHVANKLGQKISKNSCHVDDRDRIISSSPFMCQTNLGLD